MLRNPPSAILYQSADREITLIDVPTSIALAQGRCGALLSTAPLEEPIQPKEDYQSRTSKTTDRSQSDTARHETCRALIQQALLDISAHVPGVWCAPRHVFPPCNKTALQPNDPERDLEFRFREWAAERGRRDESSCDFQTMMASLGAPEATPTAESTAPKWVMSSSASGHVTASSTHMLPAFYNAERQSVKLVIARATAEEGTEPCEYHFTVPPLSAFFLGDCDRPDSFRSSFRHLTDEHSLPRHFDLVLLDPPWPNRSAKRKGAYEQVGGMPYLKKMLLKMDIDNYLEHNALVGVWITNKPALRDHVLGPGGLFEAWNLGLIEEWIWIKTTTKGEPIFDIDDAMRKPYEILLLGRAAPNSWTTMTHAPNPRKRVIAAVPDIHSRKPNLKEMLEPYMPDPTSYSALEVFARSLVAGWMSWGNEAFKYNSDMYWPNTGKC
ncbi:hypothetical protein OPT61_g10232 [Boeremia exigua]|uniref:Uncharacterized protein n=1 Tax=Boeremia exigua TaxID=749465 RepID=A0ACC2HQM2_9PLEO|nr:hypothetical protein OPT61_g10232 [Boeremia exigua]